MEICVESFDGEKYTVDVGVDDTIADIRKKVASAAELCEDGFDMSFGEKVVTEGDNTTQLSAGDTVVLTKTKSQKDDAIAALRDLGETRLTSDRFKCLADPKLVHLFLQAEVVTEIPSEFLRGGTFEELSLSGVSGVTQILDCFLQDCTSLYTADLSGWSHVTHVGDFFIAQCTSLTTLDLSGWNNVTRIGSCFLACCKSLTTVDLSGWNSVTQIEMRFFSYCTSLTSLDLSGWSNVSHVPHHFLSNCKALRTLNMRGWSHVTHIGDDFATQCTSLTTLDLSRWGKVMVIGKGVLGDCNLHKCSINVAWSSRVLSEYVHSRIKRQCVCM